MAITSQLGTTESSLGNLQLGGGIEAAGGTENFAAAANAIVLTTESRSNLAVVDAENTVSLTDASRNGVFEASASSALVLTQQSRSGILDGDAESTITLDQLAINGIDVDASNTLVLTSTARDSTIVESPSSTLTLTQTARSSLFTDSITHVVTVTDEATVSGGAQFYNVVSTLELTQATSTPKPARKSATSTIVLTQTSIGEGPFYRSAESTLAFTQEALSGIFETEASNTLVFTQLAYRGVPYTKIASSTIVASVESSAPRPRPQASNELELTQFADTAAKSRSLESTLTVSQAADAEWTKFASNTLSLTQTAAHGRNNAEAESALLLFHNARVTNISVTASTAISLTVEIDSNIKTPFAEHTIALVSTLDAQVPRYASATSPLTTVTLVYNPTTGVFDEVTTGLTQTAVGILDGPRRVTHIVSFAQQAIGAHVRADAEEGIAESTLNLVSTARISIPLSTEPNRLMLTQTATTGGATKPATSTLSNLLSTAEANFVKAVAAANNINLKQAVVVVLEENNTKCLYSPFVGSSDDPDAPDPPASTYTAAGATSGFRLQFPGTGSVTDELILRAPNLGNRDRISPTRINRETRGGTLIIYADTVWPEVETLALTFSGLKSDEAQSLLTFMKTHIGREIRLVDWEDRLWRGVITNPNDPIVEDRPNNFTASFEFAGAKV